MQSAIWMTVHGESTRVIIVKSHDGKHEIYNSMQIL